jgi:hypothetical protein
MGVVVIISIADVYRAYKLKEMKESVVRGMQKKDGVLQNGNRKSFY